MYHSEMERLREVFPSIAAYVYQKTLEIFRRILVSNKHQIELL